MSKLNLYVKDTSNNCLTCISVDDSGNALINGKSAAQSNFDTIHPIGEVYMQLNGELSPNDLFNKNGINTTWTKLDFGNYPIKPIYSGDPDYFKCSVESASCFPTKACLPGVVGCICMVSYDGVNIECSYEQICTSCGSTICDYVPKYWCSNCTGPYDGAFWCGSRNRTTYNTGLTDYSTDNDDNSSKCKPDRIVVDFSCSSNIYTKAVTTPRLKTHGSTIWKRIA